MKRKRGKKKGKAKTKAVAIAAEDDTSEAVVNLISLSREEKDGNAKDGNTNVDEGYESPMEEESKTPSSTGTDQPVNLASVNPDGSIDNDSKSVGASVGRVYKVKLKSSSNSKAALESQSDTDKGSPPAPPPPPQLGSEKRVESGGSEAQPKIEVYYSRNSWKRPGGIKIKSSSAPSKAVVGDGGLSGAEKSGDEKSGGADNVVVVAENEGSLQEKEVKTPLRESRFDKQELDSSLSVIKKVMKMDAAEPFNVPVNPDALGIPDYFDVIDTPMDFGTICSNLEKGDKYLNSEDVYKDVKYIWDNCYKYNNKGDYILDLMRRVKKNFMKYWAAAGLYTEQSKGSAGSERGHGDDGSAASQGQVKGVQAKKSKKRHGRRHKNDCLCAICVLKRRRREREESARLAKGQSRFADEKHGQEFRQETSSLVESPGGEDSSSNTGESLDGDADGEAEVEGREMKVEVAERKSSPVEEKPEDIEEEEEEEEEEAEQEENEPDIQKQRKHEMQVQSQSVDRWREDPSQQFQPGTAQNPVSVVPMQTQKAYFSERHEDETAILQNKCKVQELKERQEKVKMFKKFHVENPLLLSLCGTLFPQNHQSVWGGPHSLFQHQGSTNRSSIHAAVESLMK